LIFAFFIFSVLVSTTAHAATPTLALTASSVDGNNSGTARLGMHVSFTPVVKGTTSTAVTYSLQGAGTLSTAGLYTAPAAMPASTSVTVTATLTSVPSVSASYKFAIVNPAPGVAGISPASLPKGLTNASITVWGGGFVPGSKVLLSGVAVPTTYVSASQLTAQVTVSTSATGSLPITVVNAAPGGGTSNALQVPVAAQSLTLSAASVDGTNSGTARLGMHVSFTAVVSGKTSSAVTWSLQGAGSLTTAGLYTAPATMPASSNVKVTAALTASPSITASYSFVVVNPVPGISSASPTSLPKASTNASVSVWGGGFVPGSKVMLNGTAVPTTYTSASQVVALVSLPSTATGSLPLTVVNPTPGGGTSNTLQIPVAAQSLSLNASSVDGTNSGTARLGMHVSFTPVVKGTTSTSVTYSLKGAGTLTSAGLYTTPAAMPASSNVTVTATLVAFPSVTASYNFVIVNPVPGISNVYPTTLTTTSAAVEIFGSGLVPGSVVRVNGSPVATTYQATSELIAQITAPSGQSAPYSLTVQNPQPGGGIGAAFSMPTAVPGDLSVSPTTFGTGSFTITVTGTNFSTSTKAFVNGEIVPTTYVSPTKLTATAFVAPWVTTSVEVGAGTSATPATQISVPVSNKTAVSYEVAARFSMQAAFGPRPDIVAQIQSLGLSGFLNQQFTQQPSTYPPAVNADSPRIQFTYNALAGSDLLRQRVAFALEDLIAVSIFDGNASISGTPWQELMEKDAFGNFRDLMTDITLNTTMGKWLDLGNNWAPTNPNIHPNQNYARELLQIFTMGPVKLNDDGSTVTDGSGNPVPSYDEATVLDMSRALTGWALPPPSSSPFSSFGTDFSVPMVATDSEHDHGAKVLFDSVNMPGGQSVQADLKQALDAVFAQASVPPYISKLLIQHLVKSNPSAAYIERISHVFENNGQGVRGDLTAVVRAILLDPEARSGDSGTVAAGDGHLQEPILYFLSVMSGLGITPTNNALVTTEGGLGEYLWQPESVFSFFSPSFNIPGTAINAPEFQIFDGNYMIQRSEVLYNILRGTQNGFNSTYRQTGWLMTHFATVPDILNAVNHMYYHGTMSAATITAIENYCSTVPDLYTQQLQALYLALNSDTVQISH
jgi:uncharacterized protein (DUF1800 family)/stringent starvation protein B